MMKRLKSIEKKSSDRNMGKGSGRRLLTLWFANTGRKSGTLVFGQHPWTTECLLIADIVELILGSVSCGPEGKNP